MFAGAAVSLLATAIPAKAQADLQLEPAGQWVVNYAEHFCDLSRTFGTGRDKVVLSLSAYGPDGDFAIALFGNPLRTKSESGKARVSAGDVMFEDAPYWSALSNSEPAVVFTENFSLDAEGGRRDAAYTQVERDSRTITVEGVGRRRVVLATGSLGPALSALRQCTVNLAEYWKLDPAHISSLRSGPVPVGDDDAWLTPNDFPSLSVQMGRSAIVRARLLVEPDGSVSDCVVQLSTGGEAFDRATCDSLMARASFAPAQTFTGEPVRWYWRIGVVWNPGLAPVLWGPAL